MRALLVADSTAAPFEMLPANGTSGFTVTPSNSTSGVIGAALLAQGSSATGAAVPFNPGDTNKQIIAITRTSLGNALHIAYGVNINLTAGSASSLSIKLDVFVDGVLIPQLETVVGFTGPGIPTASAETTGLEFWVTGLTPGSHTVELDGTFVGTGATANISRGGWISIEDWQF